MSTVDMSIYSYRLPPLASSRYLVFWFKKALFPISIGCSICKKMSPSSATDYNGSGREEFLSKHCEIHWLYTVLLTQLLVVLHISSRSEISEIIWTNPQTDVAPDVKSGAAMCVRNVNVQRALQFALLIAFGRVLHRLTSRVIHRSQL